MGSPISGLIAEAVLQRLERVVFAAMSPKLCYIDDKFVIIKHDNLPAFHQLLNKTLPGISFTMETTAEYKLPFLDVLVHKLPPEPTKLQCTERPQMLTSFSTTIAAVMPTTNAAE